MMNHTKTAPITPRTVAATLAMCIALVGCSSSDDATEQGDPTTDVGANAADAAQENSSQTASNDNSSDEDFDLEETMSTMPLDATVSAIETAMKATKVEIDGSTIHVHLDASAAAPQGTECMILASVLPDGATAVVHRDGQETTC